MNKRKKCLFPASHPRAMAAEDSRRVASLHRFHDRAALYVHPCEYSGHNRKWSQELTYLTANEARAIARALLQIARSIERVKFVDSEGTNFTVLEEGAKQ